MFRWCSRPMDEIGMDTDVNVAHVFLNFQKELTVRFQ